jgi:hypothetical protein
MVYSDPRWDDGGINYCSQQTEDGFKAVEGALAQRQTGFHCLDSSGRRKYHHSISRYKDSSLSRDRVRR